MPFKTQTMPLQPTTLKKIQFKEWTCYLVYLFYGNNRMAIQLQDVSDHSTIAVATVNIPDAPLGNDEVFIKSWSENETMYETLLAAGVISEAIAMVPTGFCHAHKCKLLIPKS